MGNERFESGKRGRYRYVERRDWGADSSLGEGRSIQVEKNGAWKL
jgi:hypothetical protein